MRFVLDTHVCDRLVETAERQCVVANLCRGGQIELLMTHVQIDEIRANPSTIIDPPADEPIKVADAVLAIPSTRTDTYGLVLDRSRLGLANG